jgi:hypothetical protein
MARKVSDEFTRGHHREVHRCGDEAVWWRGKGVDPTDAARSLWLESHPLPTGASRRGRGSAAPDLSLTRAGDKAKPNLSAPSR